MGAVSRRLPRGQAAVAAGGGARRAHRELARRNHVSAHDPCARALLHEVFLHVVSHAHVHTCALRVRCVCAAYPLVASGGSGWLVSSRRTPPPSSPTPPP